MKKMFTFLIAVITLVSMFGLCIQGKKVEAKEYKFERVTADIEFNFDLFQNSTRFSKELAKTAIALAASSLEDAITFSRFSEELGFELAESYNYGEDNFNRPVYNIASQSVNDKTYILLVVRATKNMEDVLTDVVGGGINGFIAAGSSIYRGLQDYIRKYYGELNPDSTVLFITGYSLGGACASQVLRMVHNSNLAPQENIFAYTIASPRYDTEAEENDYPNLFNIVVDQDLIPKVPPFYNRLGKNIYYNNHMETYTIFETMMIVLFVERMTDIQFMIGRHHKLDNYYRAVINDDYNTRSSFDVTLDAIIRTIVQVAERLVLWG